jgi:hypothetical protein
MGRLSREQLELQSRPKRVPVSEANRDKLFVAGLDHENYMYRWVNDEENRLATYVTGWWEFVDQNGNSVGDGGVEQSTGTSSKFSKGVGRGVTAYLMRIPKEFWLEDQHKKEQDLQDREAEMKQSVKKAGDYGKVEVSVKSRN